MSKPTAPHPCPNCGYCPTCKRSTAPVLPYYPHPYPYVPWYPFVYPVVQPYTITWGGTTQTITFGTGTGAEFTTTSMQLSDGTNVSWDVPTR